MIKSPPYTPNPNPDYVPPMRSTSNYNHVAITIKIISSKGDKTMDKRYLKKTGEELQEYLMFRRRGSKVKAKKGKGSFKRNKKVEAE